MGAAPPPHLALTGEREALREHVASDGMRARICCEAAEDTATDDMIQAFPIVSGDNAFADQTDTCTHKPLKILHTDTVDLLGIKIEFCKKITESRFLIVKDREKGIDTCY